MFGLSRIATLVLGRVIAVILSWNVLKYFGANGTKQCLVWTVIAIIVFCASTLRQKIFKMIGVSDERNLKVKTGVFSAGSNSIGAKIIKKAKLLEK